jgi:hypothetical protein
MAWGIQRQTGEPPVAILKKHYEIIRLGKETVVAAGGGKFTDGLP